MEWSNQRYYLKENHRCSQIRRCIEAQMSHMRYSIKEHAKTGVFECVLDHLQYHISTYPINRSYFTNTCPLLTTSLWRPWAVLMDAYLLARGRISRTAHNGGCGTGPAPAAPWTHWGEWPEGQYQCAQVGAPGDMQDNSIKLAMPTGLGTGRLGRTDTSVVLRIE